MVLSNVIVDVTISRRSFVFGHLRAKVLSVSPTTYIGKVMVIEDVGDFGIKMREESNQKTVNI